jgi:hypothetical protein
MKTPEFTYYPVLHNLSEIHTKDWNLQPQTTPDE